MQRGAGAVVGGAAAGAAVGAAAGSKASNALADGTLRTGEDGPDVAHMQRQLAALGATTRDGERLKGTGFYGDRTVEVVAGFQRTHGLPGDGVADKATRTAIEVEWLALQRGTGAVVAGAAAGATVGACAGSKVSITEPGHPAHPLYAAIGKQLPAGTKPEVIAGVTMQAIENGIATPDKLKSVTVQNGDAFVMGTTPGARTKVDLDAPVPSLQQTSAFLAKEAGTTQTPAAAIQR